MSEEQLDRFARGDLTAAESRELARKSLDDSELFDELTSISIARANLSTPVRRRNLWPRIAMLAAAAAVILGIGLIALRRSSPATPTIVAFGSPTLLARSLDSPATSFRSLEPDSRAPRQTGSVVSAADGIATIDLGSLDGLTKGDAVVAIRDGVTIGTINVTTIFRERARGEILGGAHVRPQDQIRAPSLTYTTAVLEQIDALSARGDTAGAMRIATQSGVENLDLVAENYADLNNLGVIAEMRGDRAKAGSFYERALRANPPAAARTSIESNLARAKGAK